MACGLYLLAEWGALGALGLSGLGFPLDDSWIHVAFAQNMADGAGLSINPGEPVTGSTAPLWTAWVAVLATFVSDPEALILPMKLSGIALHLLGVLLTWSLGRRLGLGVGPATAAAALVALSNHATWSALSGMEIPLFVALCLAGMLLHLDERDDPGRLPVSLFVLALSAFARPEGAMLAALAVADRLLVVRRDPDSGVLGFAWPGRRRWRSLAAALVPAALVLAPVVVAYLWIWGSPLPTTYAAKAGGAGSGVHLPDGSYLSTVVQILFNAQSWATLAALGGVVVLVSRLGTERGRGLLPALWLLGLPVAYSMITPLDAPPLVGNFGRYFFPLVPVLAVVAMVLLAQAVRPLGLDRHRPLRLALALALLFTPALSTLVRGAGFYGRNVSDITRGDVTMAKEMARELPPEAVVATIDLGAVATFLPNRIIDLAAIADPEVRSYVDRAVATGGTTADGIWQFVIDRQPDYLMIFPSWLPPSSAPPEIRQQLELLRHIHVSGNMTLGGDDLILLATPWTDRPLPAAYRKPPAAGATPPTLDLPTSAPTDSGAVP